MPVPPHILHPTILSPFLNEPRPSQFLHGFSPALFGMVVSSFSWPQVEGGQWSKLGRI
jgi:hypothetical protein